MKKGKEEMLKEELLKKGFDKIYFVEDKPHAHYALHEHPYFSKIVVLKGSILFNIDGKETELNAEEEMNIEINEEHSATAGAKGCRYIIAERHTKY